MAGALAIAWSMIRNVTSGRLLGRISSGTGRAEELTPAQVRSLCSLYSTSEVDAIAAAKVSAASLALGTSGSDLAWSGTTLNVPDAGAAARGVVTTGAQTFGGSKTFAGGVSVFNASVQTHLKAFATDGVKNAALFQTASGAQLESSHGWLDLRPASGLCYVYSGSANADFRVYGSNGTSYGQLKWDGANTVVTGNIGETVIESTQATKHVRLKPVTGIAYQYTAGVNAEFDVVGSGGSVYGYLKCDNTDTIVGSSSGKLKLSPGSARVDILGVDAADWDGTLYIWNETNSVALTLTSTVSEKRIGTTSGPIAIQPFSGHTWFYTIGTNSTIRVYDATASLYAQLAYDGTDGVLSTSDGKLKLSPATTLQVTKAATFDSSLSVTGALNFPPITKSALLALTPTAATAGRWRVTDATPASREAYPDGTNWRYTSDDTIVV